MKRLFLPVVAVAAGAAGCGKKSSDSNSGISAGAPPLVASDLVATSGFTLNSKIQADMLTYLNHTSYFYNNQPATTKPSACDSVFNTMTFSANATNAKIDATVDMASCLATDNPGATYTTATGRFYLFITCTAGDLSGVNGKALPTTGSLTGLDACTQGTILSESVQTIVGSVTVGSTTTTVNDKSTTYEGSTASPGPCGFTFSGKTYAFGNDCEEIDKDDSSSPAVGSTPAAQTEDLTKITYKEVADDDSTTTAVWHAAGTMNVTYGDWTGTVTYTSSSAAPTYSMGQPGETPATGTMTATSGG